MVPALKTVLTSIPTYLVIIEHIILFWRQLFLLLLTLTTIEDNFVVYFFFNDPIIGVYVQNCI